MAFGPLYCLSVQILSGSALAYYSSAYGEKNQDRQEYQKLRPLELYMGHSSPTKAPLVFPRRSRRRKQHPLPRGLKVKTISKYLNILFSFYVRPILSISLLVIGGDMLHCNEGSVRGEICNIVMEPVSDDSNLSVQIFCIE